MTHSYKAHFFHLIWSTKNLHSVRSYIKNQEKQHQTMTFEEEYLKFLDGQSIEYGKRFVFG